MSALLLSAALASAAIIATPGPTQIVVDLIDDADADDEHAIEAKLGGIDLRLNSVHAADDQLYIADVPADRIPDLLAALKDDPRVEAAEANAIYHTTGAPNDPMWDRQWSFRMVQAAEAWTGATGAGVTVAVIDTGVAYETRGEFRQVEDLAKTEFAPGYDFVGDDAYPNDDHGHGTHVAGTIAQTTNNGVGVAGLAHGATIMPIKVLDRLGRGHTADIADAIRFAADEGAHVINMSLGGGMRSLVMQSAVAYAKRKGVVIVCAAGNTSRGVVEFPAAYPGTVAVSAVGPTGTLAPYSSWGKAITLAAPGGDKRDGDAGGILQNTITPADVGAKSTYLAFQGTSMAAPHVAAAAALIISSGVTNPDAVHAILSASAKDSGPEGWDERYGAGILDAAKAVTFAKAQSHGLTYLMAALMALMWLARRLKRRAAQVVLGVPAVIGAVFGASGLFFLGGLGLDQWTLGALITHPIATWDLVAFGPDFFQTALWASLIPFLCIAVALLAAKRWTGFLIGLGVGWAVHLLIAAVMMPADVLGIPGAAGLLDRAWLVANAGGIAFLTSLLSRR